MAAATLYTTYVHEGIDQFDRDLYLLFHRQAVAKDAYFLRRMALTIRQLHFDLPESKIAEFIRAPLTESRKTLLEAADRLGEQDPRYSDLSELLAEIASLGPLFIRLPRAADDPSALCL